MDFVSLFVYCSFTVNRFRIFIPLKSDVFFSDIPKRGRSFELIKSHPLYVPPPSLLNLLLVLQLVPLDPGSATVERHPCFS